MRGHGLMQAIARVNRVFKDKKALSDEIARIKKRLEGLMGVGDSLGHAKRSSSKRRKTAVKPGPKRNLSPKVRAQRVLQGRYMGVVRNLPAAAKKQVAAIREKSGYRKAIAEAKRMAAKK